MYTISSKMFSSHQFELSDSLSVSLPEWQYYKECMTRLLNKACDYQEKRDYQKMWLPDRWMDRQTDAGKGAPYVPLSFTGNTKIVLTL